MLGEKPDLLINIKQVYIVVNLDEGIEVECSSEIEMQAKLTSYHEHGICASYYRERVKY